MSLRKKKYSKFYRIRKAYSTAFSVIFSYLWFKWKAKLFGETYYQKRLIQLHIKNAEKVKHAILELEGLFIKVGQLLSVMSNYLPAEFQKPLEGLQDKIPARPYDEIRRRIHQELGNYPEDIFASFHKQPIAAASIAQAHRATLQTGEAVVVKVQHHNIEAMSQVDLEIIRRLTNLTARYFKIKGLEHAYLQVRKMIEEELDFRQEATAMQTIQQQLANEPSLKIPKPFLQYSSERVLTTSFQEGVKIGNIEQIDAWNLDRRALADRLLHIYCQMVFVNGFYHADPHPGNILVQQDGSIVLLDFGATDSLPASMRKGFLELIDAAIKNDTEKTVQILKALGFIAEGPEATEVAEKMVKAFRLFLETEFEFEGLSIKDFKVNPFENSLIDLIKDIGFQGIANTAQVPKEWVLLNRMVTLLVGICGTLEPKMNPLTVVRPYFKEFLVGEESNFGQLMIKLLRKNLSAAVSIPTEFQKLLSQVKKGDISVKTPAIEQQNQIHFYIAQQFILLFMSIFAAIMTYIFWEQGNDLFWKIGLSISSLLLLIIFIIYRKLKRKFFRR